MSQQDTMPTPASIAVASLLGITLLAASGWIFRKQVSQLSEPVVKKVADMSEPLVNQVTQFSQPLVKQVTEVPQNNPWVKSMLEWLQACPCNKLLSSAS